MTLSYELKIPEAEIRTWTYDDYTRWIAFFKIRDEQQKLAARKHK